ncbi:hypothetical protein GYH30_035287 [Glycine max]|nr:hypothetical protein GYH30_035287 [Glycine max]
MMNIEFHLIEAITFFRFQGQDHSCISKFFANDEYRISSHRGNHTFRFQGQGQSCIPKFCK